MSREKHLITYMSEIAEDMVAMTGYVRSVFFMDTKNM